MEEKGSFFRGIQSKLLHFIYLLPILLGFRPLILNFSLILFILYTTGFLILLTLVLYSNNIPYILYDKEGIYIQLEYREGREPHPFDQFLGYYRKKNRILRIFSLEHRPLNLRMGKKDLDRMVELLESKGIAPVSDEVARGKK